MGLVEIEEYQEGAQAEARVARIHSRLPTSIIWSCPDDFCAG